MKICPRCYKESPGEVHTCTPRYSDCCRDDVCIVGGRFKFDPKSDAEFTINKGKTYYYLCQKCNKPCDLSYEKSDNDTATTS